MPAMPNGRHYGLPTRQAKLIEPSSFPSPAVAMSTRDSTWFQSGRVFVLIAGLVFLVLWAVLYLSFRDWRARYHTRARFGETQVAPVIDALAETVPRGINPAEWREAIKQTHSMLLSVTGSNLLNFPQMQSLRAELEQAAKRARAHPDSAVDELALVWDSVADRAEFVLWDSRTGTGERHPRPRILPPRRARANMRVSTTAE
jgi:hypothetical protein